LAALKSTLEGEDVAEIQAKTQSLATTSMKLGEAMYKDMQSKEANVEGESAPADTGEGTVVDAEFEDVEEEKEKKKSV
jgi:molecular chaperone DnaK